MINNVSRLDHKIEQTIIETLKARGFSPNNPPTDVIPFTVAITDAACCNTGETVYLRGSDIPSTLARLTNLAGPIICDGTPTAITMRPDAEDEAACPPDKIWEQWRPMLRHYEPKFATSAIHRLTRPEYYSWLAGASEHVPTTPAMPKVDLKLCADLETHDYANLGLVFDLAGSSLLGLPQPVFDHPQFLSVLQRAGHMNSLIIHGGEVPAELVVKVADYNTMIFHGPSFRDVVEAVLRCWVPDGHVQPGYRGATTPFAVHGTDEGMKAQLQSLLDASAWKGFSLNNGGTLDTLEELSTEAAGRELEGFNGIGRIEIPSDSDLIVVLTNGVTREPKCEVFSVA